MTREDGEGVPAQGNKGSNPHDGYFHDMMTYPATVRGLLRDHMDKKITRHLDLTHIKGIDTHFVTLDMQHLYSDKVFQIRYKNKKGYIYLLVEHQSTPSRFMAFRVLQYLVGVWHWWLKENPGAKNLPIIIPMVIYHGKASWQDTLHLKELFTGPLVEDVPLVTTNFPILDLAGVEPHMGQEPPHTWMLLTALKHVFDKAYPLQEIMSDLKGHVESEEEQALFRLLVKYIFDTRDDLEPEVVADTAAKYLHESWRRDIVTVGERLRSEGRVEGRVEGREEKALEIAVNMLRGGMDMAQVSKFTGLSLIRVQQIHAQMA